MRIIVWGINYAPEVTGIAPYNVLLCEHLQARGHGVEMVTSFAYYPTWRKRPEDQSHFFRTDSVGGVPVHRCWHYVPRRVSALKRIFHEGSFVLTSFFRLLALRRADVVVVMSPPLLLGAAAWVLRVFKGAPFVFHVQDLQPDAALGLGMLKPGLLTRALYSLEALAYRHAAGVSGISRGMLEAFASKGVPTDKRVYFPNGITPIDLNALPSRGEFRRREGFAGEVFLAVYSGNLGVKQGLSVLIEAAADLHDSRIRIIICGDGAARSELETDAVARQLTNVRFLPLQEKGAYEEMLVDADLCLITQQAGSGRAFFPSKLMTALNFAKPVLTVADAESELTRLLAESSFGVNVEPGRPEALARELEVLAGAPERLAEMGRVGRIFAEQFEASRVLESFERCLAEVVEGRPPIGKNRSRHGTHLAER